MSNNMNNPSSQTKSIVEEAKATGQEIIVNAINGSRNPIKGFVSSLVDRLFDWALEKLGW